MTYLQNNLKAPLPELPSIASIVPLLATKDTSCKTCNVTVSATSHGICSATSLCHSLACFSHTTYDSLSTFTSTAVWLQVFTPAENVPYPRTAGISTHWIRCFTVLDRVSLNKIHLYHSCCYSEPNPIPCGWKTQHENASDYSTAVLYVRVCVDLNRETVHTFVLNYWATNPQI